MGLFSVFVSVTVFCTRSLGVEKNLLVEINKNILSKSKTFVSRSLIVVKCVW